MTSVTNSSGLNFQNGINPLGRKVRALEAEVISLRSEINLLKSGGVKPGTATATATATSAPVDLSPSILAELDLLKREIAIIKGAGYGKGEKGEKGDRGEKGDKGDRGETGPMTYIAMPQTMMPTTTTSGSA